jgi:hypothetical protein
VNGAPLNKRRTQGAAHQSPLRRLTTTTLYGKMLPTWGRVFSARGGGQGTHSFKFENDLAGRKVRCGIGNKPVEKL